MNGEGHKSDMRYNGIVCYFMAPFSSPYAQISGNYLMVCKKRFSLAVPNFSVPKLLG